jgi:hypothetical protein
MEEKSALMEALEEQEAEFDKPLWERLGKVIFLGVATMLFSVIAENGYDKQLTWIKGRKENARTRDHV